MNTLRTSRKSMLTNYQPYHYIQLVRRASILRKYPYLIFTFLENFVTLFPKSYLTFLNRKKYYF